MNIRLKRVKKELDEKKLDAILITSVPNITYLTNFSNFSKDEREAYLFITRNKQYVITDARFSEAVSMHVKDFELIEITQQNSLTKILKDIARKGKIKKVGFEPYDVTVSEYKRLSLCFNDLNHDIKLDTLRNIKDETEIESIQTACKLTDKTFGYILKKLRSRVSEKEVAFEIELFIKKQGADISFKPIVAFGKNSSVPHHQTGNDKLNKNSIVLLDFGVKLNDYCSDMTRTVFFGKASSEQKKMYKTVLDAQKKAIDYLNQPTSDGGRLSLRSHDSSEVKTIKAKDIDSIARKYIIKQGYPTIPHSLGHGVGLEVHESPRLSPKSKDELKPDMVFSIEPGIYLKGIGGIRIEDLVVLEKKVPRILTKSPKNLTEL